jgi:polyisoprenoid-binding protein YceI
MTLIARIAVLTLLGLGIAPGLAGAAPVAYEIDATHSSVQFVVTHLGVARVAGHFDRLHGQFAYDPARIEASKVQVTVRADSIGTGHEERDNKLRSDDFFATARFPEIRFESTSVTGHDGQFALQGNLTLRGVSRPVTFQVTKTGESRDPWGGYRAGFEATTTIKRSDFGMRYMLGAVGDDVALTIEIEGIRQK